MKLLYLSNFFNHHQKPLADALYAMLGDDYSFIETWGGIPVEQKKLGYHEYDVPYIIRYSEQKDIVEQQIRNADVVIYGEAPISIIKARYNTGKLTIRDDESRYKNPNRYLKWLIYSYKSHWINKGYLLCASAYAPVDYMLSGMNPKKCFRWGYFPEVKKYNSSEELLRKKGLKNPQGVSILWAGRLIGLKHPEAAIYVAKRLKHANVEFTLDIIGTGKLENKLRRMIQENNIDDCVHLLGSMKPEDVRIHMEDADIFLFTSDRCEGWGAVLNESMSSGCAVVADSNIGSVPFLINDGTNGIIYRSTKYSDLYHKVKWLIEHPIERLLMGKNAYLTMQKTWNGNVAANNLIRLCEALLKGENTPISDGPCSQAPLIMRRWRGIIKVL